jgi:hypothetical protein
MGSNSERPAQRVRIGREVGGREDPPPDRHLSPLEGSMSDSPAPDSSSRFVLRPHQLDLDPEIGDFNCAACGAQCFARRADDRLDAGETGHGGFCAHMNPVAEFFLAWEEMEAERHYREHPLSEAQARSLYTAVVAQVMTDASPEAQASAVEQMMSVRPK